MNDRTIFRVMDKETTDTIHPDERKSVYLLPRRIVWKQGRISNEEVLLKERESQISLAAWDDCVMESTGRPPFCWISAMRYTAVSAFLPGRTVRTGGRGSGSGSGNP